MTQDDLEQRIIQWGIDRNIIGPTGEGTIYKQLEKTKEEVSELSDACDMFGWHKNSADIEKAKVCARDAIGDIYVTLVMQAQLWGFTMSECVGAAWNEIKDRKGRMTNGVFVKETK